MDEVKWAWVLFVAATLALLVRIAFWFLPAPVWLHSRKVAETAEAPALAPAPAGAPPAPAAAPELAAPPWPDEAADGNDWPFVEPLAPAAAGPPAEEPPPAPPPAEFHLRRTRWGMSPDEVRAAERDAPLRANDRTLMYAATTLELPCLVTYLFADGRLVRAQLAFSDPAGTHIPPLSLAQAQRRFLFLREQLGRRYGTPVEKTVRLPRDVSDLERRAHRQDELAKQYDVEIAEAEARLEKQREILKRRFARWKNPAEMVARDLAPHERDLRELRRWKQEALDRARKSREGIRQHRAADAAQPLVATMTARWTYARELHDIELKLDARGASPRLVIRYQSTQNLPDLGPSNEL